MEEFELKTLIRRNPETLLAQAYRLGRKEANIELENEIREVLKTQEKVSRN